MSESGEFSVIDGKLVREDDYEANFEENLTFEGDLKIPDMDHGANLD